MIAGSRQQLHDHGNVSAVQAHAISQQCQLCPSLLYRMVSVLLLLGTCFWLNVVLAPSSSCLEEYFPLWRRENILHFPWRLLTLWFFLSLNRDLTQNNSFQINHALKGFDPGGNRFSASHPSFTLTPPEWHSCLCLPASYLLRPHVSAATLYC